MAEAQNSKSGIDEREFLNDLSLVSYANQLKLSWLFFLWITIHLSFHSYGN